MTWTPRFNCCSRPPQSKKFRDPAGSTAGCVRRSRRCAGPAMFSPPKKRACSIFMQRSITTSSPAGAARLRRLFVNHAELHPDHLGADGDRLLHDGRHGSRSPEKYPPPRPARNRRKRGVTGAAEDLDSRADSPGSLRSPRRSGRSRRNGSDGMDSPTARPWRCACSFRMRNRSKAEFANRARFTGELPPTPSAKNEAALAHALP